MRKVSRAVVVVCLAAACLPVTPAAAADPFVPVPEVGAPDRLQLASAPYPLVFPSLKPGQEYSWQLRMHVAERVTASTTLRLSATGALSGPGGYLLTVRECPEPWTGASGVDVTLRCASVPVMRMNRVPLDSVDPDARVPLAGLSAGKYSYLAVSLAAPQGTHPADGDSLRLGLGITAHSTEDDGATAVGSELGRTGFDGARWALAGGALLLGGAALWAALGRRPRRTLGLDGEGHRRGGGT
ncbi:MULTISPECIES: hypothetical protein [Arthrobacter]|uniref:Secreted protein n=2 Tax=Arthrobacter TaxID=1663 RepID=A0ABU9KLU2_9MICC|nr:hypothetical protein [Arthrobacter sp. YJM1]MDP5226481.1 hypothetical protein [Arthrobacter sp. YJM1]